MMDMAMTGNIHAAILVLTMAIVTFALRFLPFAVFDKSTPSYVIYLGKVLPAAIIGMLVIYCLKDVQISEAPHGLPELVAGLTVVFLQYLKRSALISILGGTIVYMLIINLIL